MTRPTPAHTRELEAFVPTTDTPLDLGIRYAVLVLRSVGIETIESCEGGPGHSFPEPTVKFCGSSWAGYRAFAAAMEYGLPVLQLNRVHDCNDGQLDGPYWTLVFKKPLDQEESG